jgi:hypothetical protein
MAAIFTVTDAGRAALVAGGNTGTTAHQIIEIGLGTVKFTPSKDLQALPGEKKRIRTIGGRNIAPDTIHLTINDATTDQYTLFGMGLYLENGVLFAVYSQDTAIMEKSPAADLLLSADIQFVSIDASALKIGDASFVNPPATTEALGVIELATQDEVNAGQDATRALTPKTAASRYAAKTGATFVGPVNISFDAGTETAHLHLLPPSGALGRESRLRFYGTFGGGTTDTGARLVATLRSGFDNGTWGREYLDFWLNNAGNDVANDSKQGRVMRLTAQGGVLIGKEPPSDGGALQVDGGGSFRRVVSIAGNVIGAMSTSNFDGMTIEAFNADNSVKKPIAIAPVGGRVLLGTAKDDGANLLQVAGDIASSGALQAGRGTTKAMVNSDQATAYYYASGDGQAFLGGNGKGWTSLITAGAERMRVTNAGRVLIGSLNDDGKNLLQVNGNAAFANGVLSRGLDGDNGGQFRAVGNNYGVFLRNDDANAYLLSTNKGDPYGSFNNFRPFAWSLDTGTVKIALDGSPTVITGTTTVEKDLQVKKGVVSRGFDVEAGGQLRAVSANYGALLRNDNSDVYLMSTRKDDPNGTYNSFRPFSWSLNDGSVRIGADGAPTTIFGNTTVEQDLHVNRKNPEGHIFLGSNTGYLYANAESFGWWWPDKGASLQYFGTDHTLRVDGRLVWHQGNLTPLDRNLGGQMFGDLNFAPGKRIFLSEGSAAAPSLTFINDGAPDTGLFHIADGYFGVTCNGIPTVHFAPNGSYFDKPAFTIDPPAGDASNCIPTTAWVTAAISSSSVGQIVFEMRTNARAGFLKANGALVKRADYPALWAYAQASGALVTDKIWGEENWGCFSDGDGSTTFRIPELRGEFLRAWADGRDDLDAKRRIGSWQGSQNQNHGHDASSGPDGDHGHAAWTDTQGYHAHSVGQEPHAHGIGMGADAAHATSVGRAYGPDNGRYYNIGTDAVNANVWINADGNHGHNVGIGTSGRHSHPIYITPNGGNEARPRNIAVLAMIRAF